MKWVRTRKAISLGRYERTERSDCALSPRIGRPVSALWKPGARLRSADFDGLYKFSMAFFEDDE